MSAGSAGRPRPFIFVHRLRTWCVSRRSRLGETVGRATFDSKTQWFWHILSQNLLWFPPPGCLWVPFGCLLGASWVSAGCLQMVPDASRLHQMPMLPDGTRCLRMFPDVSLCMYIYIYDIHTYIIISSGWVIGFARKSCVLKHSWP